MRNTGGDCAAEPNQVQEQNCNQHACTICTQPTDTTGYTVTETELSVASGFNVTGKCATGYAGIPGIMYY